MAKIVHLLITTDQESNIGVIKTKLPQGANFLDVNGEEIVKKLKIAISEHFDCDINKVKIEFMDVQSMIPFHVEARCVIPDVDACSDVIIVNLEQTEIY